MTTYTVQNGRDTTASSTTPTTPLGTAPNVGVGSGLFGFVYLPMPADIQGTTIASATLTGLAYTPWSAVTTTVKMVTSSWSDTTLTFNRQPSVGATSANTSVPATTQFSPINLDVTALVQQVASGAAYYGFRISAASGLPFFFSFDSAQVDTAWTLTIDVQESPDVPQSLVPNGTIVSQAKPTLSCDFVDNGGLSNDMGAINVQIDPAKNGTTPAFDSGTVATTLPLLDLTTTAYAGLASGASTFWRVRVQDTTGLWSAWSDWAGFTYRPQPTLTLLTPSAGVLWDPTSDIIASTSANMSAYRVRITDGTDRSKVRYDSGRIPANPSALTTVDVALPEEYDGTRVLRDDNNYQLNIRIWDTFSARQATPGAPAYVESWSTFHFDDDLTQTPISSLTASQGGPGPSVTLTWTRAAAPDAWLVMRDSKVIDRLDPSEVIFAAGTYTWNDSHPRPWVSHVYSVRALTKVSGVFKRSPAGVTATITPGALGIHIYTGDGDHLILDDTDTSQLAVNDRRDIYKPVNLRYDVDIVHGFEGVSGQITGVIPSGLTTSVTVDDARDIMLAIKENPADPVHLVYGNFSARVLLRNVTILPDPRANSAQPLMRVSFGVNQVGDFDEVI